MESPSTLLLKKRGWIILAFILLLAGAIIPSFYFYKKYRESQDLLFKSITDPQSSQKIQLKELLSKIGKAVELPNDETPQTIVITDISKVRDQIFLKDAQNGDIILIYRNAHKAVVYDPIFNKVIRVGPLVFPSPTVGSYTTASASPTLKINLK